MVKVPLPDYCLINGKEKEYNFLRIQTMKVRNV